MLEKDQNKRDKVPRRSILSALKARLTNLDISVHGIRTDIESVIEEGKKKANKIAEGLFSRVLAFCLILLGLIFLFLGATYKLMEAGLNRSDGFLIIGILILILGWVFSMLHRR
jgi:hypothetical protein